MNLFKDKQFDVDIFEKIPDNSKLKTHNSELIEVV